VLERIHDRLVIDQPPLNLLDQVVHRDSRDAGAVPAVPVEHAK
jgi:hypothetical protein